MATDTNSGIPQRTTGPEQVRQQFEAYGFFGKIPWERFGDSEGFLACLALPRPRLLVFKTAHLVGFYFPPLALAQLEAPSRAFCQQLRLRANHTQCFPGDPGCPTSSKRTFGCSPDSRLFPASSSVLIFGSLGCLRPFTGLSFLLGSRFSTAELVSCLGAKPFSSPL